MADSIKRDDEHRETDNPFEAPDAEITGAPRMFHIPSGKKKASPSLPYSVDCACGETIKVAGPQAGSTVQCACGADVIVPSLGRLRESVGKGRYESGIVDTIRRMIQTGKLPSTSICAVSRKPTTDLLELDLMVPKVFFAEKDDPTRIAMVGLLGGVFAVLLMGFLRAARPAQIDTDQCETLTAPIRVAISQQHKVRRMSEHRLKRLLRSEPIYAQLLEENPHMKVKVQSSLS